jgi:hypothetical protein
MNKIIILLSIIYSLDLIAQDSTKLIHPSPKRALILSAIIPGSGQVYNHIYSKKKNPHVYWKVPIIYTSLYFSSQALINKIQLEKEIRNEYSSRIDKNVFNEKWKPYDNYNLVFLQKNAAKSRNTLYFVTGGIYLLQVLEASIDAHFSHFDISPNLSLNVHPYYSNFNFSGLTFAFNIK